VLTQLISCLIDVRSISGIASYSDREVTETLSFEVYPWMSSVTLDIHLDWDCLWRMDCSWCFMYKPKALNRLGLLLGVNNG